MFSNFFRESINYGNIRTHRKHPRGTVQSNESNFYASIPSAAMSFLRRGRLLSPQMGKTDFMTAGLGWGQSGQKSQTTSLILVFSPHPQNTHKLSTHKMQGLS